MSTQLIKPDYLVTLPPTQYHSFSRNLPPLQLYINRRKGSCGRESQLVVSCEVLTNHAAVWRLSVWSLNNKHSWTRHILWCSRFYGKDCKKIGVTLSVEQYEYLILTCTTDSKTRERTLECYEKLDATFSKAVFHRRSCQNFTL